MSIKIYKVGGCVRDQLMGVNPKDIDYVVVGATPEYMLKNGFTQVGADFPVFLDDNGDEFALARTERKSGIGYNGFSTEFDSSITLEDDLLRRDLTINSMAEDIETGIIVDLFNGKKHINEKILSHVSDAFNEDPVRVLRLARFHARFGPEWSIDQRTEDMIVHEMVGSGLLNELTVERLVKELDRALETSDPEIFFKDLIKFKALEILFPLFVKVPMETWSLLFKVHHVKDADINFVKLLSLFSNDEVKNFCETFKVSSLRERLTYMVRSIRELQDYRASPKDLIMFLDHYKLFQNNDDLNKLTVIGHLPLVNELLKALESTKDINFNSLTVDQQSNLKGPKIREAILQLKVEKLEKGN